MGVPSSESVLLRHFQRAQDIGAIGQRPPHEALEHARQFVAALPAQVMTVCDLGSGAGLPGLVIALDRPTSRVTLVDRRAKRIDELSRVVRSLEWQDRVTAVEGDAWQLANDPEWQGRFDAVTARGFGPPAETLELACQLVRPGGWILISEPPAGMASRWSPDLLTRVGVAPPQRVGSIAVFHVEHRDST